MRRLSVVLANVSLLDSGVKNSSTILLPSLLRYTLPILAHIVDNKKLVQYQMKPIWKVMYIL